MAALTFEKHREPEGRGARVAFLFPLFFGETKKRGRVRGEALPKIRPARSAAPLNTRTLKHPR